MTPQVVHIRHRLAHTRPLPSPAALVDYGGALNVPLEMVPRPEALRPAAVLVPLLATPQGLEVLFTRRTDNLRNHAGQVSFPGGAAETHDADATATALREAEEEIGLSPAAIDVLGFLGPHVTISGFCVSPVVGYVARPPTLTADSGEVAEIFSVPLDYLMQREHYECRQGEFRGQPVRYYVLRYGQQTIWGATAAMLVDLYERLEPLPLR